jgi:hypothetical protein
MKFTNFSFDSVASTVATDIPLRKRYVGLGDACATSRDSSSQTYPKRVS